MESTVSGTDNQEGHHVDHPSTLSRAKLDVNLIRTSSQPITYTTAQLHESMMAKVQIRVRQGRKAKTGRLKSEGHKAQ